MAEDIFSSFLAVFSPTIGPDIASIRVLYPDIDTQMFFITVFSSTSFSSTSFWNYIKILKWWRVRACLKYHLKYEALSAPNLHGIHPASLKNDNTVISERLRDLCFIWMHSYWLSAQAEPSRPILDPKLPTPICWLFVEVRSNFWICFSQAVDFRWEIDPI